MGRVRHGLVPAADQRVHRAEVREIDSFRFMGALVVISHSRVSIAMDSSVVGSRFYEKLHLAALRHRPQLGLDDVFGPGFSAAID